MTAIIVEMISAVATIIVAVLPLWASNRKSTKALISKVDKLVDHDSEQYMAILRLTIMSEEMPLPERLIAGKKYIDLGGNGEVKAYYKRLLKEHTK